MNKIIYAAILTKTNHIFWGLRHSDCIKDANKINKLARLEIQQAKQGFLDNNYTFVDRTKALEIAKKAGQLKGRLKHNPKDQLMSEDLW